MERDGRFGEKVSQKASQMGLPVILIDGRIYIEKKTALVEKALTLSGYCLATGANFFGSGDVYWM